MKLFVLDLTSLDRRRVNAETTPYLAAALESFPWAEMSNYPGNDLLPTMLTGVYPQQHGIYGVRLKEESTLRPLGWELLPDFVTTTAQCLRHFVSREFDLAAIPPARRRRFKITRSKYRRFKHPHDVLGTIGGVVSLLGLIGEKESRYQFRSPNDPIRSVLPGIGCGEYALDWLELYTLNRTQQWHMHRPDRIRKCYALMDRFIERLHQKCKSSGVTLVLLSDHGFETVKESINLESHLRELGLFQDEYTHFLEVSIVRFWFHSDRARQRITELLDSLDRVHVFSRSEMHELHLGFSDGSYGELFGVADLGVIFYPHDFYQPLANLFLGLTDRKQFPRIFDGRQRGNCGYLPQHLSEKGTMMVMDDSYFASHKTMELIDVAPSLLALLGRPPLETMHGKPIFAPARRARV